MTEPLGIRLQRLGGDNVLPDRQGSLRAVSGALPDVWRKAIQLRASDGDPLAIMALKRREGGHLFSLDYWNAFARYEMQQAKRMGKTSKCTVNGYSVYDELFAESVIDSLSRQEQIYIRLR